MKKDNSFILNIIRTALMVIVILVIIVGITNHNKKAKTKEEPIVEEKKVFRNSELILWNNFLKQSKEKKYIIEENLESIELVEIVDYGKYLKNLPNLRYEQINFKYECKRNTTCVTDQFPKLNEGLEIRAVTTIIDLTNKEYLEITGYSFRQSDELVPIEGPFVYEGEED